MFTLGGGTSPPGPPPGSAPGERFIGNFFIMKVNVVYIFDVLPQLQHKGMIKKKERGYYERLHS